MLLERTYTINDVVTLRLVTGEEIIAKLVEEDALTIRVTKPVVVQVQMVGPQQAGLGFLPFMTTVDEDAKLTLPLDRLVVRPQKTRKDVAAQYIKMTTGLDVPVSGLIR